MKGEVFQTSFVMALKDFEPFGGLHHTIFCGKISRSTLRVANSGVAGPFIGDANAECNLNAFNGIHDEEAQSAIKDIVVPYRFQFCSWAEHIHLDEVPFVSDCLSERVEISSEPVISCGLKALFENRFDGRIFQPSGNEEVGLFGIRLERFHGTVCAEK